MLNAVIDIGSNTIRMCIYECRDGEIRQIISKKEPAGLASYVDASGRMQREGVYKAISVLRSFKEMLLSFGIERSFVFATASLRNIENSAQVVAEIERETGFDIDVLSGDEEAAMDFFGVTYKSGLKTGMLVDIGGGSTELVGFKNGAISKTISFPIGSLNAFNRYVSELFPTGIEGERICQAVRTQLSAIEGINCENGELIGVGGSIRGMFKLYNELFCKASLKKNKIEASAMDELLRALGTDEKLRRRAILKTVPDRIHTIIPGMLILRTIVGAFDVRSITVSGFGVREGYLLKKLP